MKLRNMEKILVGQPEYARRFGDDNNEMVLE